MKAKAGSSAATAVVQLTKPPKLRWLWLSLGLLGVAGLSASAGALLAVAISGMPLMQTKLTAKQAAVFNKDNIATGLNFKLPALTRPVNILVLGVKVLSSDIDNPPAGSQNLGYLPTINSLEGLSDSMLLLRFNPGSEQLVVLSLPRDSRTYIDGVGMTKINEANALGGPALAARSTSELLGGVGIDRYIRINVQGVEKLIDALGGVTLYVPEDMKYQDDSQHLYINLKQGQQHLNGAQAVQFLRFRYDAYGDIGRVQRQQLFLRALREQTLKPTTLTRLPKILGVVQSNLDTNLSVEELIALAGFASKVDRSNMQMLMLPGSFSGREFEASYWLPNKEQISVMVRRYFGMLMPNFAQAETGTAGATGATGVPEDIAPSDTAVQSKLGAAATDHVKIAIQASTEPNSQANRAVEQLIGRLGEHGYGDIYVDQPSPEVLAVTRIIAQQGNDDEARAIQQTLGFGDVLVESTGNLESDVTIRLGRDALTRLASPVAQPATSPEATDLQPDALPAAPASSSRPGNEPTGSSQNQSLPQTAPTKMEPGSDPNSAAVIGGWNRRLD